MVRTLHLIDAEGDWESTSTQSQLARELGAGFTVRQHRVHRNSASVVTTFSKLRATVREEFDLLHAFGSHALAAATFLGGKIVYTPSEFPTRRAIGWIRAVLGYRDVNIVCPTDTMRRKFVENGVPIHRCHLIRPGVEFSRIKPKRDDALREALGFKPDDYVVLPAGESTRASTHSLGVQSSTILHFLDKKYRALLWGRGPLAYQRAAFPRKLGVKNFLVIAEETFRRRVDFEAILPAADLVVVTGTGPVPTLPIAEAMASAVPIIAVVQPTVAELLQDRHNSLLVSGPVPRWLSKRILELRDDESLRWKIVDMARTEAFEFFSHTRLLRQYRAVYSQIAACEPVQVPQEAPGAGSRFHGKA